MAITEESAATRPAEEVLAWSRTTVDPALRAAVDTLPAAIRRVGEYHFGWRDAAGRPDRAAPGKALRPALALLAAEAAGGAAASAVPAAVAVELVHNFSLLHDDVMDGDTTRRNRPTAWTVFGANTAILAGDALLTLALDVLATSGRPGAGAALHLLGATVQELIAGQSADLDFESRDDVTLPECTRMVEGKTGALLGCACALGALLGAGPDQAERLRGFGRALGVAFQHVDDLLGIWGTPQRTGKPVFSDLRSRKKTLPVVAALRSDTPDGRALAELYRPDRTLDDADLVHAAGLVDAAGGRAWSRDQADALLDRALARLDGGGLAPRPAAELGLLARRAVDRDR